MKKLMLGFSITWLIVLLPANAFAQLSDLGRRWKNVRSNTDNITKIEIAVVGANVSVQAFGKCSPTDCPWGTANAIAYASNVDADLALKASTLTAEYDFGFSETRLVIYRMRRNRIRVDTFTHFKDGSARTDYHRTEMMRPLRTGEEF